MKSWKVHKLIGYLLNIDGDAKHRLLVDAGRQIQIILLVFHLASKAVSIFGQEDAHGIEERGGRAGHPVLVLV